MDTLPTTVTNIPGPQTTVAILPYNLYVQWDHQFITNLLEEFAQTNDASSLMTKYQAYQQQKKDVRFG